jgi:site-specific DNA-cytosine methylase
LPFGFKSSDPNFIPCLTKTPNIPIKYNFKTKLFEYYPFSKFLETQTFPLDFKFPKDMSLASKFGYLGNAICVKSVKYFFEKQFSAVSLNDGEIMKYVDLFAGIGGFHLLMKNYYSKCVLANDNNKKCQEIYQLNFPNTPFLLGNFVNEKV